MSAAAPVAHRAYYRAYERFSGWLERSGWEQFRPQMLAGLHGRVLEIGPGTGTNFPHYPRAVSEVVAVEPNERLRRIAAGTARSAGLAARVVDGAAGAERLPFDDASFDCAVTSHVLCAVPDQRLALAEIHRVLRPGGELHFYEHVLSESPGLARLQRALDPVWPLFNGGCHPCRDTAATMVATGFELDGMRRFDFHGPLAEYPIKPKILGVARRA